MGEDWPGHIINHRQFVAGANSWHGEHLSGEPVFHLLKDLGLKPEHKLLDFACGSLRVGRWLIPYLDPDCYFGIDKNLWLVEMARLEEIPAEVWEEKQPRFSDEAGFNAAVFAPDTFDFVLAHAILMHSCHRQIQTLLQSLPRTLKKGAILVGDTATGGADYEGEDAPQYPSTVNHSISRFQQTGLEFDLIGDRTQVWCGMSRPWFTLRRM